MPPVYLGVEIHHTTTHSGVLHGGRVLDNDFLDCLGAVVILDELDHVGNFRIPPDHHDCHVVIFVETDGVQACRSELVTDGGDEGGFDALVVHDVTETMYLWLYATNITTCGKCRQMLSNVAKISLNITMCGSRFFKNGSIDHDAKRNLKVPGAPRCSYSENIDNRHTGIRELMVKFNNMSEYQQYPSSKMDRDHGIRFSRVRFFLRAKWKTNLPLDSGRDMRALTSIQFKCPKGSAMDDAFLINDKLQSVHVLWVIENSTQIHVSNVKKTECLFSENIDYYGFDFGRFKSALVFFCDRGQCPYFPFVISMKNFKTIAPLSPKMFSTHNEEEKKMGLTPKNAKCEIVASEKAYSTCIDPLEPELLATYCTFCTARCESPVPCTQCTKVIFCNEECRSKGWKEFHAVECPLRLTINNIGFMQPFCLILALKMLIKTPFTDLKKLIPKYKEETKKPRLMQGFNEHLKYESTDYRTVYHLGINIEERSAEHVLQMCGWVLVLTKLLIKSKTYFTNNSGEPIEPTEEDINLVGSTLFRHILATRCNDKILQETQIDVSKKYDGRNDPYEFLPSIVYGNGIFPSLALFNTDCNPSLESVNYGNYLAFHAVRFIPSGSEVSVRYLPPYHEEVSNEKRRTNLYNKYLFNCKCESCEKNWVLKGAKPLDYVPKLRSPESRICDHRYDEKILQARLTQILQQDECVRFSRRGFPNFDHDSHDIKLIVETIEFYDRFIELPEGIYCLSQTLLSDINKKQAAINYFRTGPYIPLESSNSNSNRPTGMPIKTHLLGQLS
ncbi:unnamed protein product, partial [Meganyctiphanes norvegica]